LSEFTFHPQDLIYELESHRLQGETEAEDDVVRARDPDDALGLEDVARLLEPPRGELEVLPDSHRANRVTLPVTLPRAAGTRRPRSRSPEIVVRHHCKRQLRYLGVDPKLQNQRRSGSVLWWLRTK
jgi:hypothetical protein